MTQDEFFKRYKYDLTSDKIGTGAPGSVYKAFDTVGNRYIALKISEVKSGGEKKQNLPDELSLSGEQAGHRNVAKYESVHTFQLPSGTYDFAVMPFYPSGNLNTLLQNNITDQKSRESIAIQLLDGLEFLHQHGIIHRNLKPSNILMEVDTTGEETVFIPKIADFSLSKLSDPDNKNRFEGTTLQYSSPEQLKGEQLRFNTDLWSWAVISYLLLTGKELFASDSGQGEIPLIKNILEKDTAGQLKELPENWRIALHDALIKDPELRIKSASGLKNILTGTVGEQYKPIAASESYEDYEETATEDGETEEFEVEIEKEPVTRPSGPAVSTSPAAKTKAPVVEAKKSHVRAYIITGIIFIFFVSYLFYGYFPDSQLSENKAKSILVNMMKYRSDREFQQSSELFAAKTEKYFNENDVSRKEIQSDMEKFGESWSFENVSITDFGRTVENMFHFAMTYDLRDTKTHQITSYKVRGEVGFTKENDLFKISYITNRGVSNNRNEFRYATVIKRKEQDFTDYMLTYSASVLYLPEIKEEHLLDYIYSGVFTQKPSGYSRGQLQQALQDDYIDFINVSENQMQNFMFDSVVYFSKQTEMTTAFVDAVFLCIQVVQNTVTAVPSGGMKLSYVNVDYAGGKSLSLSDVINVNSVPWQDLFAKSISSGLVTAGNQTVNTGDIASLPEEPGNFYFDTKKIFFVYGADEISEAAVIGPVTVSVPLEEVEKYLTSYFRERIFNSSKVNIKKI